MRIVVALDGRALVRRGEAVESAARELAAIAAEHELVLSLGDGDADQMLELALRNALPERDLVTVLTEVVVAGDDPAFATPSKPAGSGELAAAPEPWAIFELRSLRLLIEAGVVLICAGAGAPVILDGAGTLRGTEALVDGDLTAALLARRLDADLLAMLTEAAAVEVGWGGEGVRAIATATPAELREHRFAGASVASQVEAGCRFVEATAARAAIGDLRDAAAIVRGDAGTQIVPRLA